jgi:hypothetical protein
MIGRFFLTKDFFQECQYEKTVFEADIPHGPYAWSTPMPKNGLRVFFLLRAGGTQGGA